MYSSCNFAGNFCPAEGQISTFIVWLHISPTHEQNEIYELRAGTACKNHAAAGQKFLPFRKRVGPIVSRVQVHHG